MHQCLICLGSNYEFPHHLHAARIALTEIFPNIRFGKEMVTKAVGEHWLSPFGNQLATFHDNRTSEDIRAILKRIEKDNGRMPNDKKKGIVKLDIDLLKYDDIVLKPKDLEQSYIKQNLKELLG